MPWDNRTGGSRRSPLPINWPSIRRGVLGRDGHRCTWEDPTRGRCTAQATEVDHLQRDDHRMHMLRSLCHHHHVMVTAKQAAAGRHKRERPIEQHPMP
jgi:hypothetical protein